MSSSPAKKILIVEDEKDILQLVKLYLEKEGPTRMASVVRPLVVFPVEPARVGARGMPPQKNRVE